LSELVTYLEKHACEIIDYERRAKTGKVIGGSGRMENKRRVFLLGELSERKAWRSS
jgi:hypothetical protein